MQDMNIVEIAKIVHDANRAYCQTIDDYSQPEWRYTESWQKDSILMDVQAIIDDPSTTPEKSHTGWLAHKVVEGWKYGPNKDTLAKTHPCMVPYSELSDEQKVKDRLFIAIVKALVNE